jgi:hypothetical protein
MSRDVDGCLWLICPLELGETLRLRLRTSLRLLLVSSAAILGLVTCVEFLFGKTT